jgi:hypothetical protein
MNGTRGSFVLSGLPWLCALVCAAGLAYATAAALVGASGRDAHAYISSNETLCDTSGGRLLYVGLNSWVPAEPHEPCILGAP